MCLAGNVPGDIIVPEPAPLPLAETTMRTPRALSLVPASSPPSQFRALLKRRSSSGEKRKQRERRARRRERAAARRKRKRAARTIGERGRAAGSTTPDPRQGQAKCAKPRPLAFTCAPLLHWPADPVTSPPSRQWNARARRGAMFVSLGRAERHFGDRVMLFEGVGLHLRIPGALFSCMVYPAGGCPFFLVS